MNALVATPPVHFDQLLTAWQLNDPYACAALGVQVVALVAYCAGVLRLHRRGRRWSSWRLACFVSGLVVLNLAVVSGLASYDDDVFVVHIVQHVLFMMVAPPLLALGAPVTLAIQSLPRPVRARLVRCLHHRVVQAMSGLTVSSLLYFSVMYVDFLTPFYRYSLSHELAHNVSHIVMFTAGCLFWWPMIGVDPTPHRPGPRARALAMAVGAPIEVGLGILISRQSGVLAHWYSRSDVRAGGAVFAVAAFATALVAAIVVVRQHHIRQRARTRPSRRPTARWPRTQAERSASII